MLNEKEKGRREENVFSTLTGVLSAMTSQKRDSRPVRPWARLGWGPETAEARCWPRGDSEKGHRLGPTGSPLYLAWGGRRL